MEAFLAKTLNIIGACIRKVFCQVGVGKVCPVMSVSYIGARDSRLTARARPTVIQRHVLLQ